jgi:Tfp pilus assembly protein PilN
MADGLKMILAMALFFGVMYLYSWMPEILEARRQKKREKQKLQQLANREVEKLEQQKLREEKTKIVEDRRSRIREQFEWLEGMNQKIDQIKNK